MKCMHWVTLSTAVVMAVGCASGRTPVTGTEGIQNPQPVPETTADAEADARIEEVADSAEMVLGGDTDSLAEPGLDSDNDGIVDADDQCPATDSAALVDASGCQIVTGVIDSLKFEPNESALSDDGRRTLGRMVEGFLRYPDLVISVEGHTDNRGAAEDNLELSRQRVLSVVRYMVLQGMSPDRIRPYGYGESRPRAANATAEGREQNRRIEINVVEGLL